MDYLIVFGGYLFGSISAAIVTCRLMGLPDPRSEGSRNPGTTNVLRLGGKKAALLTLVGDMLKGLLPVLIAGALTDKPAVLAATALAAFLGHLYPVFFGFTGGKGVATALGVVFGLDWRVGLATVATWLMMAFIFRYSSLAALPLFFSGRFDCHPAGSRRVLVAGCSTGHGFHDAGNDGPALLATPFKYCQPVEWCRD